MVEILIAVIVLALLIVPTFGLLSSSNRITQISTYEMLAMQYSSELVNQIINLSHKFDDIQTKTGKSLEDILTDSALTSNLEQTGLTAPSIIQLPDTQVSLLVSPLHPHFDKRRFFVEKLEPSLTSGSPLENGNYWRITVFTQWQHKAMNTTSSAEYHTFLESGQ